jgi:hypothetical protein
MQAKYTPAIEELFKIKQRAGESAIQLHLCMETLIQQARDKGTKVEEAQLARLYVKVLQKPLSYFMVPIPATLHKAAKKANQWEKMNHNKAVKIIVPNNDDPKVAFSVTTNQSWANLGQNQSWFNTDCIPPLKKNTKKKNIQPQLEES